MASFDRSGCSSRQSRRTESRISTRPVSRCATARSSIPDAATRVSRPATACTNSTRENGFCLRIPGSVMSRTFGETDHPGVKIWRIEKQKLKPVGENEHGFFHEGECYLVLWVDSSDPAIRSIHAWIGALSSEKDVETLERKSAELEKLTGRAAICTREVQGHESPCFLHNFSHGICYLEKKENTTAGRASTNYKRLYRIQGRKHTKAACMLATVETLDSSCIYLLDGFPRMYVWIGSQTDYASRVKAIQFVRRFRDFQRDGRAHIIVVDEDDTKSHNLLMKKFRNGSAMTPRINTETSAQERQQTNIILDGGWMDDNKEALYKLTGDSVLCDMPEVARKPLKSELLVSETSYLLDSGPHCPLCVWVGRHAPSCDSEGAVRRAKTFAQHRGYPPCLSIMRISEGEEPPIFKRAFVTWRDRTHKHRKMRKSYTVGIIGKALFSQGDRRTVAKITKSWSEEDLLDEHGKLQVWRLDENRLEPLSSDQHDVFYNGNCYILLHQPADTDARPPVLYYWLGDRSTYEDRRSAVSLAIDMDDTLGNKTVLIRVLDGKEPPHFMQLMHSTMMVYDGNEDMNETGDDEDQLFSVQEAFDGVIRVCQVPPKARSLSSSYAFVFTTKSNCYLWYGKECGGPEREYAKKLLGFLWPDRMYSYEITVEEKESSRFWKDLGGHRTNEEKIPPKKLDRRYPILVQYSDVPPCLFHQVHDFTQEDLADDAVLVLDTFDQVILWLGKDVDRSVRWNMADIARTYIKRDPAGRGYDDVHIWFVKQDSEPESFIKYFQEWNIAENLGSGRVEMLRGLIRQENAMIEFASPFSRKLGHSSQPGKRDRCEKQ